MKAAKVNSQQTNSKQTKATPKMEKRKNKKQVRKILSKKKKPEVKILIRPDLASLLHSSFPFPPCLLKKGGRSIFLFSFFFFFYLIENDEFSAAPCFRLLRLIWSPIRRSFFFFFF